MGVGYLGLFDRVDHTGSSEWSSRQGEAITTLQVHHTAGTSDSGARALMDPGGRTVSSNGLLLRDGTLVEVVPGQYRAFTSATGFDRQSLTVETVNQTGSPTWGISEAQRRRLAKLNRDMAAAGLPIAVGKRGVGGILGHYEVPGTYATSCPGPDMQLDHIAALAAGSTTAGDGWSPITEGVDDMSAFALAFNTDGLGVIIGPTGLARGFSSYYDYTLVKRVLFGKVDENGNPKTPYEPDTLLNGELDIVRDYLRSVNPPAGTATVDPAVIEAAIAKAFADAPISADVSPEDIAAIAGATLDGLKARL